MSESEPDIILQGLNSYSELIEFSCDSDGNYSAVAGSQLNDVIEQIGITPKEFIYKVNGLARILNKIGSRNANEVNRWVTAATSSSFDEAMNGVFEDANRTAVFSAHLSRIHTDFIRSGLFLFYKEEFEGIPYDYEQFCHELSNLDPAIARSLVSDIYSRLAVIKLFENESSTESVKGCTNRINPGLVISETTGQQRAKLSDFGIPRSVRPAGVIGVSQLLEMYGEKVFTWDDIDNERIDRDRLVTYGTTDYANPVEAIQTALAFESLGGESLYITDPTTHSVADYFKRILGPTLLMQGELSEIEYSEVLSVVDALPDVNVPIEMLIESHPIISSHFRILTNRFPSAQTFEELYREMNLELCSKLGIDYKDVSQLAAVNDTRLGEIQAGIVKREETVGLAIEGVRTRLMTLLGASLESESRVNGFLRSVFGNEVWGHKSLRIINRRDHKGDPLKVSDYLDMTIGELRKLGIGLGGNGWINLMQDRPEVLSGFKGKKETVVHKATKLGANYVWPLIADDNVQVVAMPIVRVIPEGRKGPINGDGLDISMYILYPELIDIVKQAFEVARKSPELLGGSKQIIISVSKVKCYIGGKKIEKLKAEVGIQSVEGGTEEGAPNIKNIGYQII